MKQFLNGVQEIPRDLPDRARAHDDHEIAVTAHNVQMLDDGVERIQVHRRDAAFSQPIDQVRRPHLVLFDLGVPHKVDMRNDNNIG